MVSAAFGLPSVSRALVSGFFIVVDPRPGKGFLDRLHEGGQLDVPAHQVLLLDVSVPAAVKKTESEW